MRHHVQFALVGDGSVGKSSLVQALQTEESCSRQYKQTIGFDMAERLVVLPNQKEVSLQVRDVGGQSIRSNNLEQYLYSAQAIFLVYDCTNAESLSNLDDWLTVVRKYAPPQVKLYVIGNKCDMQALCQVEASQQENFVAKHGDVLEGFYCSAKTGENIKRVFFQVAAIVAGCPLSESALSTLDKVLSCHVNLSHSGEVRNEWADEIEAQDRALEERKRRQEGEGAGGCGCIVA